MLERPALYRLSYLPSPSVDFSQGALEDFCILSAFHGGAVWWELQSFRLALNTRYLPLPGCQAILVAVANCFDTGPDAALEDGLLAAISSHLDAPVGVRHPETLKLIVLICCLASCRPSPKGRCLYHLDLSFSLQ